MLEMYQPLPLFFSCVFSSFCLVSGFINYCSSKAFQFLLLPEDDAPQESPPQMFIELQQYCKNSSSRPRDFRQTFVMNNIISFFQPARIGIALFMPSHSKRQFGPPSPGFISRSYTSPRICEIQ